MDGLSVRRESISTSSSAVYINLAKKKKVYLKKNNVYGVKNKNCNSYKGMVSLMQFLVSLIV